jgi:uncharacterized protein
MDLFESIVLRNLPFLTGGALIGVAASGLLWVNGRIAGISGIIGGLLNPATNRESWRIAFTLGLVTAGIIALNIEPTSLGIPPENRSSVTLGFAGLLIGLGTGMARGCTSGHGICGLARLSLRSLIATLTFMAAGIVTATTFTHF